MSSTDTSEQPTTNGDSNPEGTDNGINPGIGNTTPEESQTVTTGLGQSTAVISTAVSTIPTTSQAASTGGSNAQPEKASSNGYSVGALTGGIVGAAIGAAILACLLTGFFMRRRHARRRRDYRSDRHSRSYDSKGDIEVIETPIHKHKKPAHAWEAHLPQSADDGTVQSAVKTFFDQVDLHVDNFYRSDGDQSVDINRKALEAIDCGRLPGSVEAFLQDGRLAPTAIKHCIASILIKNIAPPVDSEQSLLPAYLSTITPANAAGDRRVASQAYSQWKLLTSFLSTQPERDAAFVRARNESADGISQLLRAAFAQWQRIDDDMTAFRQHERSVIAMASHMGILLMSQPSSFEFRWEGPRSGTGIVVYPGLWKTTDEVGTHLEKAQQMVTAVVDVVRT